MTPEYPPLPSYGIWTTDLDGNRVFGYKVQQLIPYADAYARVYATNLECQLASEQKSHKFQQDKTAKVFSSFMRAKEAAIRYREALHYIAQHWPDTAISAVALNALKETK